MQRSNIDEMDEGMAQIASSTNRSGKVNSQDVMNLKYPDYELEGLPWITDYHILKNKRYIITNNNLSTKKSKKNHE